LTDPPLSVALVCVYTLVPAVLVLLYERPMHHYEMASTLRERNKEESIKLRYGSLHTVVELLQRAGLILARRAAWEGSRPERTIYELTGGHGNPFKKVKEALPPTFARWSALYLFCVSNTSSILSGLRGLHRISLTRSLLKCCDEAANMTRAVSDPRPVPAMAITCSPLVTSPPSAAMTTISTHTFTP